MRAFRPERVGLALALLWGLAGTLLPGCSCSGSNCATTCAGCCDGRGKCQTGDGVAACGRNGFACAACGNGTVCSATGTCASASCNGCVDSAGQCRSGAERTACGAGGGPCAGCGVNEVCLSGACQLVPTCAAQGATCALDTDCCGEYCDPSKHCGTRPDAGGLDAGPGQDAGPDGGGSDAGGADGGGADAGSCSALSFAAPVLYDAGSVLISVLAVDVDRDGWLDLVCVDRGANAVEVLLNQKDGGFGARAVYGVGSSPYFAASADFNADGWPDLAVTNNGDGTVSVLTNAGDGGFLAALPVPSPNGADALAAGDWDGDGRPDLLVTTSGATVNLFLNRGGALAFSAAADAGVNTAGCALADVSGAGAPQALVLGFQDGLLHVLANAGDAGFGSQQAFAVSTAPLALAVGPLFGPGASGAAVADPQQGVVALLRNDAGTFTRQLLVPVTSASSVQLADINADGRADVVAGSAAGGFTVVLWDAGTFTPLAFGSQRADGVAVGDFNRDGLPDVATVSVNGQLSVYLNTCAP